MTFAIKDVNPSLLRSIILYTMGVLIIFLTIGYCGKAKEAARNALYKDTLQAFQQVRLKDSAVMATQLQVVATQNEALKQGLLDLRGELANVKNVVAQVKFQDKGTVAPKEPIKLEDTTGKTTPIATIPIPAKSDTGKAAEIPANYALTDTSKVIGVPQPFDTGDEWYHLSGTIDKYKGKPVISSPKFTWTNKYTLTIGDEKLGFFSKPVPKIFLKNDNIYSGIIDMRNVVIETKNPWYKRPVVWLAIGAISGALILK